MSFLLISRSTDFFNKSKEAELNQQLIYRLLIKIGPQLILIKIGPQLILIKIGQQLILIKICQQLASRNERLKKYHRKNELISS